MLMLSCSRRTSLEELDLFDAAFAGYFYIAAPHLLTSKPAVTLFDCRKTRHHKDFQAKLDFARDGYRQTRFFDETKRLASEQSRLLSP